MANGGEKNNSKPNVPTKKRRKTRKTSNLRCIFSSTEVVSDDGTTTIMITMPTLASMFTHQLQFPDNEATHTFFRAEGQLEGKEATENCQGDSI